MGDAPFPASLDPIADQPFRRHRTGAFERGWAAAERLRRGFSSAVGAFHVMAIDAAERRRGARSRILRMASGAPSRGTGSLALYAHFSPHSGVTEMVLMQLREYVRLGFRVVFATASPSVSAEEWSRLCEVAEVVIQRRNHGFDFGAWSDALQVAPLDLGEFDELLLANDSVVGPVFPLDEPLARLRAEGEGVFGLTESVQHRTHLQSYFLLACGRAAVGDMAAFLGNLRLSASKRLTIRRGEIGLTDAMRARGHHVAALWSYTEVERAVVSSEAERVALGAMVPALGRVTARPEPGYTLALHRAMLDVPLNPVHHFAGPLLRLFRFPFLKTELLLRNPARSPEALAWRELIPAEAPCPPELIADHLARHGRPPGTARGATAGSPRASLASGRFPSAGGQSPDPDPFGHSLDARLARLEAARAPCAGEEPPDHGVATADVSDILLERVAARGGIVLAFSHDDYAESCGGVQNIIHNEQRAFMAEGLGYLHLAPVRPRPALAANLPGTVLRLRLDGALLGDVRFADLQGVFAALGRRGAVAAGIVHHLAGHAPEQVADLLRKAGVSGPLVWTHDFFTLCTSYPLLRNDIAYCGAPDAASPACSICCHGPGRADHVTRMRAFFAETRPTVLAPSRFALDLWASRGGYPCREKAVLAPARLVAAEDRAPHRRNHPRLRIAHLGTRDFHKGWTSFEGLARRFAEDPRYEFFQLGLPAPQGEQGPVRTVSVRWSPDRRDAMAEAVARHRIDVVVHWSLCPETFSFTVHEALAGGAFVLARTEAGNVWPAISANAPGRGAALDSEADLHRLFEDGSLTRLVEAAPAMRFELIHGGGSADWLLARRAERGVTQDALHV